MKNLYFQLIFGVFEFFNIFSDIRSAFSSIGKFGSDHKILIRIGYPIRAHPYTAPAASPSSPPKSPAPHLRRPPPSTFDLYSAPETIDFARSWNLPSAARFASLFSIVSCCGPSLRTLPTTANGVQLLSSTVCNSFSKHFS